MESVEAKIKDLWRIGKFPFLIRGATVEVDLGNSIYLRFEPEAIVGLLGYTHINLFMEPTDAQPSQPSV